MQDQKNCLSLTLDKHFVGSNLYIYDLPRSFYWEAISMQLPKISLCFYKSKMLFTVTTSMQQSILTPCGLIFFTHLLTTLSLRIDLASLEQKGEQLKKQ